MRLPTTPFSPVARVVRFVGLATMAFAVAILIHVLTDRWPPKEGDLAGCAGIFTIGGLLAAVVTIADRARPYLRIDREHGNATYVAQHGHARASVPLHALGPLQREVADGEHLLRAAGMPEYVLLRATSLAPLEERQVVLQRLIDEHVLRDILARDAPHDGAFRDDPELAFRIRTSVPDPERRREVLALLARDPQLRERIATLRVD